MSNAVDAVKYFWKNRGVMSAVRSGQLIKAAATIRKLFPEATPQQAISIVLGLRAEVEAGKPL